MTGRAARVGVAVAGMIGLAGVVVVLAGAVPPEREDQRPPLKRIFKHLDADGDGFLTEDEYTRRARFGDPEKARHIFHASDADRDGKVTEAEYVANRIVTDKAKEVFAWINSNGDAVMTRREVAACVDRVFEEMDSDTDGRVTIPEFMRARWRWQVRVDWKKRAETAPGKKAEEAKSE